MSCEDEEKRVQRAERAASRAREDREIAEDEAATSSWWSSWKRALVPFSVMKGAYPPRATGVGEAATAAVTSGMEALKAQDDEERARRKRDSARGKAADAEEDLEEAREALRRCREKEIGWLEPVAFELTSTIDWRWEICPDVAVHGGPVRGSLPAVTFSESVDARLGGFAGAAEGGGGHATVFRASGPLSYRRKEEGGQATVTAEDGTRYVTSLTAHPVSTSPGQLGITLTLWELTFYEGGKWAPIAVRFDVTNPTCHSELTARTTIKPRDRGEIAMPPQPLRGTLPLWSSIFGLLRCKDGWAAAYRTYLSYDLYGHFDWTVQGDREIARKTWHTSGPRTDILAATGGDRKVVDREVTTLQIAFVRRKRPR